MTRQLDRIDDLIQSRDVIRYDVEIVTYRLEEAGMTLLSLPGGRLSTKLSSGMPEIVRNTAEAYGYSTMPIMPPVPSASRISRMDEALAWVLLIPLDRSPKGSAEPWSIHGGAMLRSIVGARMLISPVTERNLFSWRRLGEKLGCHHASVKQWHAKGIARIVASLNEGIKK